MKYLNLMKQSVWHRLFCAMLATVACTGCSPREALPPGNAGNATEKKLRIAVVPKATSFQFWQSVHAGARKAAAELDVELIWKGPAADNDRAEQIKVVQQFSNASVDGILLAPTDGVALAPEAQALLARAMRQLGLSARAYHRVLRVARTIADLAARPSVCTEHVAEAITLRQLDRRAAADGIPVSGEFQQ